MSARGINSTPACASSAFEARCLASFESLSRAQRNSMFHEHALGADYYLACERAPIPAFRLAAVATFNAGEPVAAMPLFNVTFRPEMPLQGLPRRAVRAIGRAWPRLGAIPILGVGSPTAEELTIGFAPGLEPSQRLGCFEAMLDALERKVTEESSDLAVLKDVTDHDAAWAHDILTRRGYGRSEALPLAVLDLPFRDESAYLASLSPKMRSDLRRKLRQGAAVRIELRDDIHGLERDVAVLYAETRAGAGATYDVFDQLPDRYFSSVLDAMPGRAKVLLSWLGDDLVAFALLVLDRRVLTTLYVGMRQPLARQRNVYFLNWMAAIRLCLQHRIPRLHAGQSSYRVKARLGARLERSWIYYRHRNRAWNAVFRVLGSRVSFARTDADLVALGDAAPYRR